MPNNARYAKLIALLMMLLLGNKCATPSLEPYTDYLLHDVDSVEVYNSGLTITFLGTSTLLFDDGDTSFITDAFFSRPSIRKLRRLKPDTSIIRASLERAGVTSLAAVIPLHSHFDHVLDAPVVALMTGAMFVGSESSANVARGHSLPEDQIRIVDDGETLAFGNFRVTFIISKHHTSDLVPGIIAQPMSSPAKVAAYKTGDCFSLLVEHENRSVLVHASAGFIPGALSDHAAEVVFLGIGRLGTSNEEYRLSYWDEVVEAVGARRVIPIHWDNFFRPLDKPLVPMPRLIDNFDVSMNFLIEAARATHVDLRIPLAWAPINPFDGLSAQ